MLIDAAEYHAHLYFEPDALAAIAPLHAHARAALAAKATVWPIRDRPVGPHPLPMFEIAFPHAHREAVLAWIAQHRGDRVVLLHPVTGDDLADHTLHARWLGEPLPLNLAALEP